ncbi:TetR/AcrR family transcriptional regulator [Streptomyces sp. SID11385]|uniref:TetR/AcrR family transcriptional regulator n=1 Tax=Streptomyces sp. SID11385 TaxID=2706031 RepID=UPI0013C708B4|nr:TetR/AcrR family transcriptional regulator [Streptomyces sp. SID11385]NEA40522.1 TetR/AcrR family transcriptional regulator [Streptomyces sp. SID11385]
MARWEPHTKERLARAALELYGEHGYERTTVAQIAARAGLTERTYFRHFPDKREVLFDGSHSLETALGEAVAAAPADASPRAALAAGLDALGAAFEGARAHARRRQAVVAAQQELQERELIKLASLTRVLAGALRLRGVEEPRASLLAEAGAGVFKTAFTVWVGDERPEEASAEEVPLTALLREGLDTLGDALAHD